MFYLGELSITVSHNDILPRMAESIDSGDAIVDTEFSDFEHLLNDLEREIATEHGTYFVQVNMKIVDHMDMVSVLFQLKPLAILFLCWYFQYTGSAINVTSITTVHHGSLLIISQLIIRKTV